MWTRIAGLCGMTLALVTSGGCYRYAFDLAPPMGRNATITYVDHPATFLNGFIGKGRVEAKNYCADPIRTQLKVGVTDVLVAVGTLLIYTPHTLEVVCPAASVPPTAQR